MGFITILTFNEYNYINNAGEIYVAASRVTTKEIDHSSLTYSKFKTILSNTPIIGFSSDYYIIADIKNRKKIGKKIKINILLINNFYALTKFSSDLLKLHIFNDDIENIWNKYVKENCKDRYNKIKLFYEIIKYYINDTIKVDINDDNIIKILDDQKNISYYPKPEEKSKIENFLFSNAYGWKAGLTVLYRLALDIIKDDKKLKNDYWIIPPIKKDLDKIRINELDGPILKQKIVDTIKLLDNSLSKIENNEIKFPPICYLAIVLQYISVAENKDYISIDNFIQDLNILKTICEDNNKNVSYWIKSTIINVGQFLNGKFLCDEYKKIGFRSKSTSQKSLI